jgi:transposase
MRPNLFWLSDEQWRRIEPYLPKEVRGKPRVDDRRVISRILHVLKSGCRWCDCPLEYGPYTTIYNRFVRWAARGVWERLFREHAAKGRSTQMQKIDSTHIKAHRSASGAWPSRIGLICVGRTALVHWFTPVSCRHSRWALVNRQASRRRRRHDAGFRSRDSGRRLRREFCADLR